METEAKTTRPHIKQNKILHKNRAKQMEEVMGVQNPSHLNELFHNPTKEDTEVAGKPKNT